MFLFRLRPISFTCFAVEIAGRLRQSFPCSRVFALFLGPSPPVLLEVTPFILAEEFGLCSTLIAAAELANLAFHPLIGAPLTHVRTHSSQQASSLWRAC